VEILVLDDERYNTYFEGPWIGTIKLVIIPGGGCHLHHNSIGENELLRKNDTEVAVV
jgi:hypothetical protein